MEKISIQILGSAAAEGIPALFCDCPLCQYAWEHKGKDVRKRTAYKINDRVRLDFGPDSMAQEFEYDLHSERLKHIFITHPHTDHLTSNEFTWRMPGFSHVPEDKLLNVYGSQGVVQTIKSFFGERLANARLNPVVIKPFEAFDLPDEDQTWYPMPADHMYENPAGEPFIYAVRLGKKYMLVANDTVYFSEAVWKFLEEKHFVFDLVISDCTGAMKDQEHGHMSGRFVLAVKERLEKIGCITGDTRYFINHFSHNGRATHAQLEEHFNPYGIEVGYDGLEISF